MRGLGITNGHMHTKQEQETNYTLTSMGTLVGVIGGKIATTMCTQIIEDIYTITTNQLTLQEKFIGLHCLEKLRTHQTYVINQKYIK